MKLMAVLGAACVLSACSSNTLLRQPVPLSPTTSAAFVPASTHVTCSAQQQDGCGEFRALSFRWDAQNPVLHGLDSPPASQQERQDRVQHTGPRLWQAYREGKLQAATPKTFLVLLWNVNPAPVANLAAYQVNTAQHRVARVPLEPVVGGRQPVFDPAGINLGPPQMVFRIRTSGNDAVGASLQIPWSMVTDRTHILICDEDPGTVYPYGKDNGHHVAAASLAWLKNKGSKRILIPFLFRQ